MDQGGAELVKRYSTLEGILKALYPSFPWDSSVFFESAKAKPHGYWAELNNQREVLNGIGLQLGVTKVILL